MQPNATSASPPTSPIDFTPTINIINNQAPTATPPTSPVPSRRPVFAINGSFARKTSATQRAAKRLTAAEAAAAAVKHQATEAEQQLTDDWLTATTAGSRLPRNPSALSIFDMTPRRNYSAVSLHAEREVLSGVRRRLEQMAGGSDDDDDDHHLHRPPHRCQCPPGDRRGAAAAVDAEPATFAWWQRVFIFFDLDLLRDPGYVNLMVGVTIASFAELNYSILTPFVLADYGLSKAQTATAMSLLGACDIAVRFCVPFLAELIGWQNKTFFLVGVLGMAAGRVGE